MFYPCFLDLCFIVIASLYKSLRDKIAHFLLIASYHYLTYMDSTLSSLCFDGLNYPFVYGEFVNKRKQL